MNDCKERVAKAVQHFWKTRTAQREKQRAADGKNDVGNRGAVTGGKHLDGFVDLVSGLLSEAGLPD